MADISKINIDNMTCNLKDATARTELGNKIPLTVGTAIPNNTNLFTLSVGKYYKQTSVSTISNLPTEITGPFYCIIENTISSSRRRIVLYPCSASQAGIFFVALETGSGYTNWFKFTGTEITTE